MNFARRAAAYYYLRQRQRGRQFASALTVHTAGLTVVGADQFNGNYAAASFVQSEIDGLPWVALTSGVTGGTPLRGNGTMSDGEVIWMQWGGKILAAPNTPS